MARQSNSAKQSTGMAFLPEHIEKRISGEVAARGLVLLELRQRGQRNTTVVEVIVDSFTYTPLK